MKKSLRIASAALALTLAASCAVPAKPDYDARACFCRRQQQLFQR